MKTIKLNFTNKEFQELQRLKNKYAIGIEWTRFLLISARNKIKELERRNKKKND